MKPSKQKIDALVAAVLYELKEQAADGADEQVLIMALIVELQSWITPRESEH
jgi:hypothetical protein